MNFIATERHGAGGNEAATHGARRSRLRARILVALAVLIASAALGSDQAAASGLLSWTRPAAIDPQANGATPAYAAVSCPSSALCVLVGRGMIATSADPTGPPSTWTDAAIGHSGSLAAVSCPSASVCVAVGDSGDVVSSSDPGGGPAAWSTATVSHARLSAISCSSPSWCVAAGQNVVLTSSDPLGGATAWHATDLPYAIAALSCPTSTLCVGIGSGGSVIVSSDPGGGRAAWTSTQVSGYTLDSVSCASASLCAVTGVGGDVATSTNPSGGASSWTDTHLAQGASGCDKYGCPPGLFQAISCPSASRCLAIDQTGMAWTTSNPTGGARAWSSGWIAAGALANGLSCPTVSFCAAALSSGLATSTSPGELRPSAWTERYDRRTPGITGLSCPSSSMCAAVDGEGDVVSSSSPFAAHASWSISHIAFDWAALIGISCPSASLCVALDNQDDVLTTSDPGGGPGAWRSIHVENLTSGSEAAGLSGIACPSTSLCVIAGGNSDLFVSTDPTGGASAWTAVHPQGWQLGAIVSVTCPSTSFCVAGGFSGEILTSSDPTGGPAAWHRSAVDSSWVLHGLACASVSFCAVLDNQGTVFTSPAPGRRPSRWSTVGVAATGGWAGDYTISCPSRRLCVMTIGDQGVFASESPSDASTWVRQSIDSARVSPPTCALATPAQCAVPGQLTVVTCPTTTTCMALDNGGNAMTGRLLPPPGPARIRAALERYISQVARRARIGSLLRRRSFAATFIAPAAGTLHEQWYARRGRSRLVLLAALTTRSARGGSTRTILRLSAAGRRLLGSARRSVRITVQATFTPFLGSGASLRAELTIRP